MSCFLSLLGRDYSWFSSAASTSFSPFQNLKARWQGKHPGCQIKRVIQVCIPEGEPWTEKYRKLLFKTNRDDTVRVEMLYFHQMTNSLQSSCLSHPSIWEFKFRSQMVVQKYMLTCLLTLKKHSDHTADWSALLYNAWLCHCLFYIGAQLPNRKIQNFHILMKIHSKHMYLKHAL